MTAAAFCRKLVLVSLLLVPVVVTADVVSDWNEKALACTREAKQLPFVATRTMALVHTAVFDAVNSIIGGYEPYKVKIAAPPGSSPEAAAVAAAHAVLVKLFPEQKAMLDVEYSKSLADIPDGKGKKSGIEVGEQVAAQSCALRAPDGFDTPNKYRPATTAGVYVVTTMPVASNWGGVKPWALERGSQFRPAAPPKLTSEVWARDYDEIRRVGAKTSSVRTAEQTDIGRFWAITGPASWDPLVRELAATPGRSLINNARLFALAEIAGADAYISVFDAKYTYNFWRPITAIRNGELHGNPAFITEETWEPLIDTPLHPEYPCAHCITSAALEKVLEAEFGTGPVKLTMTSPTAPGVTRNWTTIQQWADEVSAARIYGGIHYRNSTEVGQAMGKQVGEYVMRGCMKPANTASK
jgi:hypothetical protein